MNHCRVTGLIAKFCPGRQSAAVEGKGEGHFARLIRRRATILAQVDYFENTSIRIALEEIAKHSFTVRRRLPRAVKESRFDVPPVAIALEFDHRCAFPAGEIKAPRSDIARVNFVRMSVGRSIINHVPGESAVAIAGDRFHGHLALVNEIDPGRFARFLRCRPRAKPAFNQVW